MKKKRSKNVSVKKPNFKKIPPPPCSYIGFDNFTYILTNSPSHSLIQNLQKFANDFAKFL